MSKFRYELKFVLNESKLSHLLFLIKQFGFKRHFPKRTVNSIYFEDHSFSSVKDNISGISKRKKVRLRWYDKDNTSPFIEIKKRSGRVGNKIKFNTPFKNGNEIKKMNSKDIYNVLNGKHNIENKLLMPPNLRPILFVSYDRDYLISNQGIRLTIDKKIQFRSVSYFNSINSKKKFFYNKNIVEIKFPIELKQFMKNFLKKTDLIPTRHSKYLVGISKLGMSSYI